MFIYFDLDGVIADFDSGVKELASFIPLSQNTERPKGYDDDLWRNVRKVDNFYYKLKVLPNAKEMIDLALRLSNNNVAFLSGVPKPHRQIFSASDDKKRWVKDILQMDLEVFTVNREDKIKFCKGKDTILVDDYKKNVKEWITAGGTGILHTDVLDTCYLLKKISKQL